MSEGKNITIMMPKEFILMVYPSQEQPGTWLAQVSAETKDVIDGEIGYFGSKLRYDHEPTIDELRAQAVDFFDHEVREQLGMNPHGG